MPVKQLGPKQFAIQSDTNVSPQRADCSFAADGSGNIVMTLKVTFKPELMNNTDAPIPLPPGLARGTILDFDGSDVSDSAPGIMSRVTASDQVTLTLQGFAIRGKKGELGQPLDK